MNISWKFLIVIAFFVTTAITAMDLFYSLDSDPALDQYQTVEIQSNIREDILQNLANSSTQVYVHSTDISREE